MNFFKIFFLLSICFISPKNELKMNIKNTTNINITDFILYDFS